MQCSFSLELCIQYLTVSWSLEYVYVEHIAVVYKRLSASITHTNINHFSFYRYENVCLMQKGSIAPPNHTPIHILWTMSQITQDHTANAILPIISLAIHYLVVTFLQKMPQVLSSRVQALDKIPLVTQLAVMMAVAMAVIYHEHSNRNFFVRKPHPRVSLNTAIPRKISQGINILHVPVLIQLI